MTPLRNGQLRNRSSNGTVSTVSTIEKHWCVNCGASVRDCSNALRMTEEGCCSVCTVENDTHGMITVQRTFLFNRLTAMETNTTDLYKQYVIERAQHVIFRNEVGKFVRNLQSRIAALEARDAQLTDQVTTLETNQAVIAASLGRPTHRTTTLWPRSRNRPAPAD
jgi:hypothetical protein